MIRSAALGLLSMIAIAVAAVGVGVPRQTEAGEVDPQAVVEDFFAQVDDGDIEGAAAFLADDLLFTEIHEQTGSFAVVGKPAFSASVLEESLEVNLSTVLTELDVDGDVVTGVAEFSDDVTEAAGVDRRLQPFTITLNDDGDIARADFTFDSSDAQTATYIEYQADQGGEEDEGPPPGSVTVALAEQAGGSQPGVAILFEDQGITVVGVFIESGPAGILQPAHFHTGTCGAPGPIVQPLASVLDGQSFTLLSTTPADLVDQGLIINVHKSAAEAGAYVSCGEVLSAEEPPPAPTAAPPAPTAPPTGVTAPNTGTGGRVVEAHTDAVAAVAFLVLAGLIALGAGGAMRVHRR